VIGFGSGMTSAMLLESPRVAEVVTIEIEPAMIEGARAFLPRNAGAYDDARSRVVVDDAKAYFARAGRRFDLVISEPSNPWVSGTASLFTEEFYGRVVAQLAPGGVFAQWIHTYEFSSPLMASILRALRRNFSDYAVYESESGDLVIVSFQLYYSVRIRESGGGVERVCELGECHLYAAGTLDLHKLSKYPPSSSRSPRHNLSNLCR